MKNFDTRAYSIADFLEWSQNGLLELSPDFQRRAVWSEKAKSYLMDTILRGRPIPKILISQKLAGSRTVRALRDQPGGCRRSGTTAAGSASGLILDHE